MYQCCVVRFSSPRIRPTAPTGSPVAEGQKALLGYSFEKKIKYHLDHRTLRDQRERLECRRFILTHMSQDMLSRLDEVEFECAYDGQIVML